MMEDEAKGAHGVIGPAGNAEPNSGGLMDRDVPIGIRQLMDKDQIIDLVHRYSYYVDHRLYDEVVGLFTEDCVVDYGPGIAPVRSRAALRRMFGHPGVGDAATSHHNANVLVTFEDLDHASVRTSVYAWHKRSDGVTPQLWGYYHDTVVRLSEGWRIAHRQLRVLGAEDWPMEMHPAIDVGSMSTNPERWKATAPGSED